MDRVPLAVRCQTLLHPPAAPQYLFSGALTRPATRFCSMKKSKESRKPRPMALTMALKDREWICATSKRLSLGLYRNLLTAIWDKV